MTVYSSWIEFAHISFGKQILLCYLSLNANHPDHRTPSDLCLGFAILRPFLLMEQIIYVILIDVEHDGEYEGRERIKKYNRLDSNES